MYFYSFTCRLFNDALNNSYPNFFDVQVTVHRGKFL